MFRPLLIAFPALLLAALLPAAARGDTASGPALDVVKSDARSLNLELHLIPDLPPDLPRLQLDEGLPLPFLARLFAAPPGAHPEVRVRTTAPAEFTDIEWPDAPLTDTYLPAERVTSEYLGVLRGVETHALRLFPYSYNRARRTLRVYTHLQVEVRFPESRPAKKAIAADPHSPWSVLLNADQAAAWQRTPRAAKAAQADWYDPEAPWIKLHLDADGLYRIYPKWFADFVEPAGVDPRSFRLFYLGQEQPLHVAGQADGRFDPGDFLLFHGRYRRDAAEMGATRSDAAPRDFDSLYGRRNTYWLTWGGAAGRRYTERSGAPVADYPQEGSFWTTAHFEQDLDYDALAKAPDDARDHWFWREPVRANKADVPSSALFPGDLLFPDLAQEYQARLRVMLHGFTDLGHHTVLKLNNRELIDDQIWGGKRQGQVELLVDKPIPSSSLRDGRNRVLLQVFADQEKFDWIFFNWFAVDYRRLYSAWHGYLEFSQPASTGHRIAVNGLRHRQVELLDIANGIRFTDVQVVSLASGFTATFEDLHDQESRYAIADRLAIKTPRGTLDLPSRWRDTAWSADYLIIAHPDLLAAGRRLAEHRQTEGLQTALISVEDLYDEFTYGRPDRNAVRDFLAHAYHNCRPTYVLLLGDETWDYRNIQGGGTPAVVPSLFYQSRGRGTAPSDFLYALVDGDDLLADFHIGRLAASSRSEATAVVDKIIGYDLDLPEGEWRNRMIYLANYHPKNIFTDPSDSLAARYTEPTGLASVKVYNTDESPIPNETGRAFVDAFNDGALLLNFNGHGSAGTMQFLFTLSLPDWGYLGQLHNGRRLPLVLALSCLNGLFANPTIEGLAEMLVNEPDRGAIAYISASAKSFVAQNDLLSDLFFQQFFTRGNLRFGPALDAAKAQVLAAHSSWVDAVLTMQLIGDPAQKLALASDPDYAPLALDLDEPLGQATLQIDAVLRNNGRSTLDSLAVVVLGHPTTAPPETLFAALEPPFAGTRTLSFAWPVGARRGPYRLELLLDGHNRIADLDETNNRLVLELDILEPLLPTPLFPPPDAALLEADLLLEAAVPLDGRDYQCEFALATAPDFTAALTAVQPAAAGVATYAPAGLGVDQAYFWRVRLHSNQAPGPWSPTRSFRLGAVGSTWHQRDAQLLTGTVEDLAADPAGQLAPSSRSLPLRPSEDTREDGFTVRDLQGSGVVVSDGTYLYAKRWYNDDSTIYPGIDFFTRIGTGLNDTFRSGNFGVLADSTTAGISATYHRDGHIYNESGKAFEIERIRASDGVLDTVAVPDGLLEWKYGRVTDGHSLITSDGTHIYNVAMSSEKGTRTEWRIRVFDPAQDWSIVREFTSPPTENGFTFEWTDGILADGERLYLIEWEGQRRIRMIDAFDGTFLDEWQSGSEITRIITGQYDWINNKVWMGDLWSSAVFRYAGLGQVSSGQITSQPIGPAARWGVLAVLGTGPLAVDVLVAAGDEWTPHPQLRDLAPGDLDLAALDATTHPQIRLRARLAAPSAQLSSWSVDFAPRPSLALSKAQSTLGPAGLRLEVQLRNLGPATNSAQLTLAQSNLDDPLRTLALAPLARGETRLAIFDSLDIPPARARLFAVVTTALPDAFPADNRLEIPLFFAGRIPLSFALWPAAGAFISGDPLRPDQGLLVEVPDLADARIELFVDGIATAPDSTLDAFPAPPRLLWRPDPALAAGRHHLEARVFSGADEIGRRKIAFRYGDALRIANALLYPHPVRQSTAFTYVLSGAAEVEIEIFGLAGRLIRRLGPFAQESGFQQVAWDGRDDSGAPLANGTYLYRIAARNEKREVVFRGPLAIVR
ncbi:MAG: C25 family cysteine peptidase [Candidatus Latescibacterota bacterium]|nr:C25 family cysteine peptidase [Candidatus Latescibacterota bacterium]